MVEDEVDVPHINAPLHPLPDLVLHVPGYDVLQRVLQGFSSSCQGLQYVSTRFLMILIVYL